MATATPDRQQLLQVSAVVAAQERAQERFNAQVLALIAQLFAGLRGRGWYNDDQVAAAADRIARQVRAAQLATGRVTAAYLDQVYRLNRITPPRSTISLPELLRPVDPIEQWSRPAKTYRASVANGVEANDAEERAIRRARQMLSADLNLAMREAARQRMEPVPAVIGYRRLLRPELSKYGSCGLCVVAADRIYKVEELLPIHELCKCRPIQVLDGQPDPGLSLNETDLKALYAAAGSTSGDDLKRIRVKVADHGELGPILRPDGQNVRTLEQAVEDRRMVDPATVIRTSEDVIARLLERQAAGEDVSTPLAYHRKLVERMRARLAA